MENRIKLAAGLLFHPFFRSWHYPVDVINEYPPFIDVSKADVFLNPEKFGLDKKYIRDVLREKKTRTCSKEFMTLSRDWVIFPSYQKLSLLCEDKMVMLEELGGITIKTFAQGVYGFIKSDYDYLYKKLQEISVCEFSDSDHLTIRVVFTE